MASPARPLIVFDLDGTLVDSQLDLANSTNEVLRSAGGRELPVNDVAKMVGDGAPRLVARALAASGCTLSLAEALDRFKAAYDRRLLETTKPYPKIDELIRALSSYAELALLTNKPEAWSRRLLDAFAMAEAIPHVIGGDSGYPRKPNPAGLSHLIASAGATPETTMMVGDSMIDVETARAAGVQMCIALYGFGRARGDLFVGPADYTAEDPAELGVVILRWLRRT